MKLTCTTKNYLPSIVDSVKSVATKLPVKVIVASALLIGFTGSIAMDLIVFTAPSYAKVVSKTKVRQAKKRVTTKKPVIAKKRVAAKKPVIAINTPKVQSAVKFFDAKLEAAIRQ
jgi:internalin A